ncbi:MAG: hypothetical protein Kilf2KO_34780 [Rhodospirillales bacterium]
MNLSLRKADKLTKAVIYCRVSSAKQVREGHGLGSQETRCREYAKHKGLEVAERFQDEGVSGGLIDRPGMQAMLAFLERERKTGPHVVIIDDISRLARGLEAHIQLRTAIQAAGGKLESPSIEFGEDSDSILVENLLASVSQHQRQKNAEQVVNRMRARIMKGYWVFAPPVGYRYERVAGHGKMLVRDEPNAAVVTEALEGFATGRFQSLTEVQRFLRTIPTIWPGQKDGACYLTMVKDLLERPLYAGFMDVAKWGIRLQPAQHDALISFETWQTIQKRLKGDAPAPMRKDTRSDFPLRGFVTCSCCERPMSAAWTTGRNGRHAYYFCQNKACERYRKSIRRDRLEEDFERLLQRIRPAPSLFNVALQMMRDLWQDRLAQGAERRQDAKARISQLERKTAQLMERVVQTDSPTLIAAYEDQIQKLEEERLALTEQAQKHGRPQRSFEETFRTACEFLSNPWKLWGSEALEDKRTLLRLAFAGRLAYCKFEGFRTANLALPFKALAAFDGSGRGLVELDGIEPTTSTMPL